jgi:hypothetical protein
LSKRPPFVGHSVDSFDVGKYQVADDLAAQGWSVSEDAVYVGNRIDDPPSSGWATFIAR